MQHQVQGQGWEALETLAFRGLERVIALLQPMINHLIPMLYLCVSILL